MKYLYLHSKLIEAAIPLLAATGCDWDFGGIQDSDRQIPMSPEMKELATETAILQMTEGVGSASLYLVFAAYLSDPDKFEWVQYRRQDLPVANVLCDLEGYIHYVNYLLETPSTQNTEGEGYSG